MKTAGIIMTLLAIVWAIAITATAILGHYEYDRTIASNWNLADKASTISQKTIYIDKFIASLEASGLKGNYNAVILQTPDNSFDMNLEALKSLQTRLHEIQRMDVKSFEYQTAIQQITAQEQGEAEAMLSVFSGTWWRVHHILLWNWVCAINITLLFIVGIVGSAMWMEGRY